MNSEWEKWVTKNKKKLSAGFEEEFIENILSRIRGINPSDVIPQYGFTDHEEKMRRIDFVVQNKGKGFFLAIELDGLRRKGTPRLQKDEWADFLRRQNALVALVGPLLRFSNHQMFNEPNIVIARINGVLSDQVEQSKQERKLESDKEQSENELRKLKNELSNAKNAFDEINNSTVSVNDHKEITKQLLKAQQQLVKIQINYDNKESTLSKLQNEIDDAKEVGFDQAVDISKVEFEQINEALRKSGEVNEALAEENTGMSTALKMIVAIVVISMVIIIMRTGGTGTGTGTVTGTKSHITLIEVANHMKETKTICGKVAQISRTSSNTWVNMGYKYPKQKLGVSLSKAVTAKLDDKFNRLESLIGQNICLKGYIKEANNRYKTPIITLSNVKDINHVLN
jgi:hypothetical protein